MQQDGPIAASVNLQRIKMIFQLMPFQDPCRRMNNYIAAQSGDPVPKPEAEGGSAFGPDPVTESFRFVFQFITEPQENLPEKIKDLGVVNASV